MLWAQYHHLPLSLGFFHFKNEGGASLVVQW